jgi:photosystem II stability/assembly factor-like uncharacterized protein
MAARASQLVRVALEAAVAADGGGAVTMPCPGMGAYWPGSGQCPASSADLSSGGRHSQVRPIDPSSPTNARVIYVGTRDGGIWKTTDGGSSWTPTTDFQPVKPNKISLETEAIAVVSPTLILAGTGLGSKPQEGGDFSGVPDKSIGMLRSTDAGTTWWQTGPTWTGAGFGSDPTQSTVDIREITVSGSRVWAATSKGLCYSLNAGNPNYDCRCTQVPCTTCQVTWTQVPLVTPTGTLNRQDGTPDYVNHIFVSPVDGTTLYASVILSDVPSHNGWYRSTNGDGSGPWTPINSGLPSTTYYSGAPSIEVQRASIAHPSGGSDAIYSILGDWRLWRTTDSGQSWSQAAQIGCAGDGLLSVQADPQDLTGNTVFMGGVSLYRSTDGGTHCSLVGAGKIHGDENALVFDPNNHNLLYAGNDGGIYKGDFTTSPETWTHRNGNLANLEFYQGAGAVDRQNYGVSYGGTQDNGQLKGSNPLAWTQTEGGDGALTEIVDPTNSNIVYLTLNGIVEKSIDGGRTKTDKVSGLPNPGPPPAPQVGLIRMDPGDSKTLVAYSWAAVSQDPSNSGQRFFRTTTAAEQSSPPAPAWLPISPLSPPWTASVSAFAVAPSSTPPSNLIFAGAGGVWRTTDAANWSRVDQQTPQVLPSDIGYTSIAIDTSLPCNATLCTLYVTTPPSGSGSPGHIFQSTNSGQAWAQISGNCNATHACANGGACIQNSCPNGLPDVQVNKVVVAPDDNTVLYAGTVTGLYKGCLGCRSSDCSTCNPNGSNWICSPTGTSWIWSPASGIPPTAVVSDLQAHEEAGLLRAFTYGRSVWELQAFTPYCPDQKVDTSAAVSNVLNPQISSDAGGGNFDIAWVDDRAGANNWHVQLRGYTYDSDSAKYIALFTESRVDDASMHVTQSPSLSVSPVPISPFTWLGCAYAAWQDDRLDTINHTNHVFFQYICPSGAKKWLLNDIRADSGSAAATTPSVAALTNGDAALAWRSGGSIYERFFNWTDGSPKTAQCGSPPSTQECKVNAGTAAAARPAVAVDGSNNVFVAWEDTDGLTARIWISKYGPDGACLIGSGSSCSGVPGSVELEQKLNGQPLSYVARSQVTLATDYLNNVIATWWEAPAFGEEKVIAKRCANDLTNCVFLEGCRQCLGGSNNELPCTADADCVGGGMCAIRASCPPSAPSNAQHAKSPGVAATVPTGFPGQPGGVMVTWQGNVNDPSGPTNAFARTFAPPAAYNDFRLDKAGRSTVLSPRVAHGLPLSFLTTWSDTRAGHSDVYMSAPCNAGGSGG